MTDQDENDVDDPEIDDLFPFLVAEESLIAQLSRAIRKALATLEPDALKKAAVFLYAMDRLPYPTPGVDLDLAITRRPEGGGLSYVSAEISENSFRLSTGGSEYTPDVGSDCYSRTLVQMETGGFREGSMHDFEEWLDAFVAAGGEVTIEDQNEEEVDLTEATSGDGWNRLAEYWDARGEWEFAY